MITGFDNSILTHRSLRTNSMDSVPRQGTILKKHQMSLLIIKTFPCLHHKIYRCGDNQSIFNRKYALLASEGLRLLNFSKFFLI